MIKQKKNFCFLGVKDIRLLVHGDPSVKVFVLWILINELGDLPRFLGQDVKIHFKVMFTYRLIVLTVNVEDVERNSRDFRPIHWVRPFHLRLWPSLIRRMTVQILVLDPLLIDGDCSFPF